MFPEEFIKRISVQEYLDPHTLLRALGEPSPPSIRINRGKWDLKPSYSEPVPWSSSGFYLPERPSYTMDPLFHGGCYYPQEASGMFIEEAFLQAGVMGENIRVLDLCGAPGGKSLILSDLVGPGNLLISNEVIRSRAQILAENVTKWGRGNVMVTQSDPSAFRGMKGFFDAVLIDAPCSGEGMFRSEVAVREWSPGNAFMCSERQKRILMDIWPSIKDEGILIYSTCTFNPAENEENIKWLIEKDAAEVIRLDILPFPGITEIDFQGIYGYGFYPGKVRGEGFFTAVIRKKTKSETILRRSKKSGDNKPSLRDTEIASGLFAVNEERIIRDGERIIALPCNRDIYKEISGSLRIIKPGTILASVRNEEPVPTHELALSSGIKGEAFPSCGLDFDEALSFLRKENMFPAGLAKGWNLLKYKGVNLGFVKNIGNRVNNYYPVEWRIRQQGSVPDDLKIIDWDHSAPCKDDGLRRII
jgi:16S rRNA C967 or C1407 C5-methylase (RsmB/RsmF family)/NOL1/NOP2/fmu family ribosome biogenesis protein